MTLSRLLLLSIPFLTVVPGPSAWSGTPGPDTTPAGVVESFNNAVTKRDLDTLLDHFIDGGVQFNLRPSHGGLQTGPLTTELRARWSMVGPVLFSATSVYTRDAEILQTRTAGDLATVWADISTSTTLAGNGETSTEQFSEVYLLVRTAAGWRIAAVADNRQPDDAGIGED
jgi:ketosteroid isomerase-like protein